MESVKKNRCVIVAAGIINSESTIKSNIYYDDYVIAADAGYIYCKKQGITPDLIIGDFDSADTPETDIETIILNPIKDCTDSEFAINEAVKRGYDNILLIGGLGGRNDHSFANIALTAAFKQKEINVTVIDENHKIYALKDEKRTLHNSNKYISVFAYAGECTVTLTGFCYPLNNYVLSPFQAIGTSNEIIDKEAEINIISGTAIIMEVNKILQ